MVFEKIARKEETKEKKDSVKYKDLSAIKSLLLLLCGFFFMLIYAPDFKSEGFLFADFTTYERFLFSSALFFISVFICIKETVDGVYDLSKMIASKSAVFSLFCISVTLWAVFTSSRNGITGEGEFPLAPFIFSNINIVLYALSEYIDKKAEKEIASKKGKDLTEGAKCDYPHLLGAMLLVPSLVLTFAFLTLGNAEKSAEYSLYFSVCSLPMLPIFTKSLIIYSGIRALSESGITPGRTDSFKTLSKLPQNIALYGRKGASDVSFEVGEISLSIGDSPFGSECDVYMEKGKSGFSNGARISERVIKYENSLPLVAALVSFVSGIVVIFTLL